MNVRTRLGCRSPRSDAQQVLDSPGSPQQQDSAQRQPAPDMSCHAQDAFRDYPAGDAERSKPANITVTPGDGTLTVSWTPTPRDGVPAGGVGFTVTAGYDGDATATSGDGGAPREGVSNDEIRHAPRWSQVSGVWEPIPTPCGAGARAGRAPARSP